MIDLTFQMGWMGGLILVIGALVIGVAFQLVGTPGWGYEWIPNAFGALVGGFVASEYLGELSKWGPDFDGLFASSALVGGLIIAAIVALVIRLVAGSMTTGSRTA